MDTHAVHVDARAPRGVDEERQRTAQLPFGAQGCREFDGVGRHAVDAVEEHGADIGIETAVGQQRVAGQVDRVAAADRRAQPRCP